MNGRRTWGRTTPGGDATRATRTAAAASAGSIRTARHICTVAILGQVDWLPWQAAKILFQQQRDFNYVEERHLWEDAVVDENGIHLAGMHYRAVLAAHEPDTRALPALETLAEAGRLLRCGPQTPASELLGFVDGLVAADVNVEPAAAALRVRRVQKGGRDWWMLFNEEGAALTGNVQLQAEGPFLQLDPWTGHSRPWGNGGRIALDGYQLTVVCTDGADAE